MLLTALSSLDRAELRQEAERLQAAGAWNGRTAGRLAYCALGLGMTQVREEGQATYHRLDCSVLATGAALFDTLVNAGVDVATVIPEALAELLADHRPAAVPPPSTPLATLPLADSEDGDGHFPAGFRIAGWANLALARAVMGDPDNLDLQALRQVFAEALRAHRAGNLASWMDAHPHAGAVWPGRPGAVTTGG